MYPPPQFSENRSDILVSAIRKLRLGAFVTYHETDLLVSHLPVHVEEDATGLWINTHVSRANQHWRMTVNAATVAIFQGPHAYIRPSWVEAKRKHGKVVPTWNYVAVHAHGSIDVVHDPDWLHGHLLALTEMNESGKSEPWSLADAPPDFIRQLTASIVGIRLKVSRLSGIWKLSQHHSEKHRADVVAGLRSDAGDETSCVIASLMEERGR